MVFQEYSRPYYQGRSLILFRHRQACLLNYCSYKKQVETAIERRKGIPLEAWEVVQWLKHLGGLRVGDIIVKNATLLFKWWWWFLEGNNPLWKRIVISNHYKQASDRIVEINEYEKGGLWGQIIEVPNINNEVLEVFSNGIWRKMGKGISTLFWDWEHH